MLFIARALYRKTSKCEYYFIYFIIVEIRNEGAAPDVGSYLPRLLLLLRNLLLLLLLLSAHLTKCELNICSLSLSLSGLVVVIAILRPYSTALRLDRPTGDGHWSIVRVFALLCEKKHLFFILLLLLLFFV